MKAAHKSREAVKNAAHGASRAWPDA